MVRGQNNSKDQFFKVYVKIIENKILVNILFMLILNINLVRDIIIVMKI